MRDQQSQEKARVGKDRAFLLPEDTEELHKGRNGFWLFINGAVGGRALGNNTTMTSLDVVLSVGICSHHIPAFTPRLPRPLPPPPNGFQNCGYWGYKSGASIQVIGSTVFHQWLLPALLDSNRVFILDF